MLEKPINFKELLKKEALKVTRHRIAILELLEQSEIPLTAEQILKSLMDKTDPINLSTIYRTLETFSSKNLILKSSRSEDDKARYGLNHHEHKHHLFCVGCQKLIPIESCPIGELQQTLKNKIDFEVTGHNLEIYGYCHNCKKA